MRKKIYDRLKIHLTNGTLDRRTKSAIKDEALAEMVADWKRYLESPNSPGEFTKRILVPRMDTWLARKHGSMTFHVTQIMTGHGCFSRFLHRIGRRDSAMCDLCGDEVDDVLHTLRECPVWDPERIHMKEALGLSRWFTLEDVFDSILESNEKWNSFAAFVEKALRDKEDDERRRERERRDRLPSEEPDSDW